MTKQRLDPRTFNIPVEQMRQGYRADKYFVRTVETLRCDDQNPVVLYQFFIREPGILCGIDEAIAILKLCAGRYVAPGKFEYSWQRMIVKALYDGDVVVPWMPFMTIEGPAQDIAHLETVLLGVVARGITVATGVNKAVKAANGKPLLFFAARFQHYLLQEVDGYAAMIGGAQVCSTDANMAYVNGEGNGTAPHALIACYEGSTANAMIAFDKHIDPSVNRVALVDWDNNCIKTTEDVVLTMAGQQDKTCAEVIGTGKGKLWGVRFDTSGSLRDAVVDPDYVNPFGVNAQLVCRAREKFDGYGWNDLKIIVSGGFTAEKIADFEKRGVPVDAYGVGSSLLRNNIDVTADIVKVAGKECHKIGRPIIENPLLEFVE